MVVDVSSTFRYIYHVLEREFRGVYRESYKIVRILSHIHIQIKTYVYRKTFRSWVRNSYI